MPNIIFIPEEARQYKNDLLSAIFPHAPMAMAMAAGPVGGVPAVAQSRIPLRGGNILGVGYGAKIASQCISNDLAVRVYVRAKMPRQQLSAAECIPATINGRLTDVIPVGDVVALQQLQRPVKCGVSVGHFNITAGTLGCLVKKNSNDPSHYILSNNHVLANSNQGNRGDQILEPGPLDGGNNPIATLSDWENIDFTGVANQMDAAIAKLTNNPDVDPEVVGIGRLTGEVKPAQMYMSVRKHGRTTRHTVGIIDDPAADIRVAYGNRVAWFENQISIVGAGGNFSAGGDSGSVIVDGVSSQPVALLFAGGGQRTFASPIGPILQRFQVTVF